MVQVLEGRARGGGASALPGCIQTSLCLRRPHRKLKLSTLAPLGDPAPSQLPPLLTSSAGPWRAGRKRRSLSPLTSSIFHGDPRAGAGTRCPAPPPPVLPRRFASICRHSGAYPPRHVLRESRRRVTPLPRASDLDPDEFPAPLLSRCTGGGGRRDGLAAVFTWPGVGAGWGQLWRRVPRAGSEYFARLSLRSESKGA